MKNILIISLFLLCGCADEINIKECKMEYEEYYIPSADDKHCPQIPYQIIYLKSGSKNTLFRDTFLDINIFQTLKCELFFGKIDEKKFKSKIAEFENLSKLNLFMKEGLKINKFLDVSELDYFIEATNFSNFSRKIYKIYTSNKSDELDEVSKIFSEKNFKIDLSTGAMKTEDIDSYNEIASTIGKILNDKNNNSIYYFFLKNNKNSFVSANETIIIKYSQFKDKDGFLQLKKEFINFKSLEVNNKYE